MMGTTDEPRDEPRDGWLKKALDHAPDTPVPPALREAILRASRSPRPAQATVPWWSRLSAWLVRPQVAAGFASVAMVTVAGLLWHDEPVPPMPASTPPAAVIVPAAEVPAPAPVAEPAPAQPPPAAARPAPPKPAPREARERKEVPPVMKPAPVAIQGQADEGPSESTMVAPPAPAPMPVPASPAAPAADMAERRAAAAESERTDSQRKSMAPSGALRRQAEAAAGAAFAPAPVRLADVRAALAATPDRWTWQGRTGPAHSAGASLSDWLALLDATAGAGWSPSPGPRTGAGELHLLRDGQPVHHWVVTDQAVFWFTPTGTWQAPVGAPAARRLLEALETLP
jgi:hypothetical protein